MRPKNINNYIVLPGCRGRQPLRAAGRTRELQLTTTRGGRIITMKSEPRTRLAPQVIRINLWQGHKVNRHLPEWRLSFLAAFAFREVSTTISVTVNFLIWKVIRISPTSFSEDGACRLAAFAIPGPASRRPANGAAAEIAGRLPLPLAAATRNSACV